MFEARLDFITKSYSKQRKPQTKKNKASPAETVTSANTLEISLLSTPALLCSPVSSPALDATFISLSTLSPLLDPDWQQCLAGADAVFLVMLPTSPSPTELTAIGQLIWLYVLDEMRSPLNPNILYPVGYLKAGETSDNLCPETES